MRQKMASSRTQTNYTYQIQVQGQLDPGWREWFNGVDISSTDASKGPPITTLTVPVEDQAALRGLLCKLWDFNLTLISLSRVEAQVEKENKND
jgi:hypothetical protein